MTEGGWKPNRSLDRGSRRAKAEKIERLIEARRPLAGVKLLEIGTGGGIITAHLASRAGDAGEVWSVDVDDLRTETEGYSFKLVAGTTLPFENGQFDIVVSNHTIEHVGDHEAQMNHLSEINRVLRPDGLAYLAAPTRWALVEPHFKVPFLSWFPPPWRNRVLQLSRRGSVYDINPRSRRRLRAMIRNANLRAADITTEALQLALSLEKHPKAAKAVGACPDAALRALGPTIPTMIFLLTPSPVPTVAEDR